MKRAVEIVKFMDVVPSDMTTWPGMRNTVTSSSDNEATNVGGGGGGEEHPGIDDDPDEDRNKSKIGTF